MCVSRAFVVPDEMRYAGEVVVTRGDSWVPDLAVSESPAFRAKASKYEKMVSHGAGRREREGK